MTQIVVPSPFLVLIAFVYFLLMQSDPCGGVWTLSISIILYYCANQYLTSYTTGPNDIETMVLLRGSWVTDTPDPLNLKAELADLGRIGTYDMRDQMVGNDNRYVRLIRGEDLRIDADMLVSREPVQIWKG